MKNFKYLIIILFALSCNKNEDINNIAAQSSDYSFQYLNTYKKIVKWVTRKEDMTDTLSIIEYYLDDLGRVYKSKFKQFYGVPGWDYEKNFVYDNKNRLIEVYRNGALSMKFDWMQDTVLLYNSTGELKTKFVYDGDRLISCGNQIYKYYDNSYNLRSIWNGDKLQSEYYKYADNVMNPSFYLKSIELSYIWETNRIMSFKPISKNIYYKQKDQPVSGKDFHKPLRVYNYIYLFDEKNRVVYNENDKALIYSWFYKYIP